MATNLGSMSCGSGHLATRFLQTAALKVAGSFPLSLSACAMTHEINATPVFHFFLLFLYWSFNINVVDLHGSGNSLNFQYCKTCYFIERARGLS
jgi:hypothetical protein